MRYALVRLAKVKVRCERKADIQVSVRITYEAGVQLTTPEFQKLEDALSLIKIHGNRTDEDIAKLYR